MVAPGKAGGAVHSLLHHDPLAVIGDDEPMQVKVVAVLHRRTVNLCHKPARSRQGRAVEAGAFADCDEFLRDLAGVLAASTTDVEAEFGGQRIKPALQRAEHARGDP